MFIGIVLRDFNYDQAVAGHSKLVRKTGMALVKSYDLYMSWGDRCAAAKRPDAELSHLVTGMSGWDQIIRTGKGRQPPELGADFKDLGDSCGLNLERNKMGLASYTEAVAEMFSCISTEDTYTLCFWGVSQVIDLLRWQFKIGMNISMATFFEKSPLHVTLYEREKPPAAAGPRNAEAEMGYARARGRLTNADPTPRGIFHPGRLQSRPPRQRQASASQRSDLDTNRCNRRFSTWRSWFRADPAHRP